MLVSPATAGGFIPVDNKPRSWSLSSIHQISETAKHQTGNRVKTDEATKQKPKDQGSANEASAKEGIRTSAHRIRPVPFPEICRDRKSRSREHAPGFYGSVEAL